MAISTDVRLATMLRDDRLTFANWDQDATAVEERYADQDPAVVVVELEAAAAGIASAFDAVRPEQWDRAGQRSDGARLTVASLGHYLLHDPSTTCGT